MSNADIVVIGAGSVGANVAYRLAERGAKVTVLEAGAPGGGTSGTSFAWTNSFHKTPRDYHELNTASAPQLVAVHADGLSVLVERRDDAQGCVAGMRNCTPVSSSETAQSRRAASSSRAALLEPTGRG